MGSDTGCVDSGCKRDSTSKNTAFRVFFRHGTHTQMAQIGKSSQPQPLRVRSLRFAAFARQCVRVNELSLLSVWFPGCVTLSRSPRACNCGLSVGVSPLTASRFCGSISLDAGAKNHVPTLTRRHALRSPDGSLRALLRFASVACARHPFRHAKTTVAPRAGAFSMPH